MEKLNIIFVCHGSICRSPAAEFILKYLSDNYDVISRAVSYEESGNDIYPPMKAALNRAGISFSSHRATRITKDDYDWADYVFYMDEENLYYLHRFFMNGEKIKPINLYTPSINEIEDPWYTGRYDLVVSQITQCVKDIIKYI